MMQQKRTVSLAAICVSQWAIWVACGNIDVATPHVSVEPTTIRDTPITESFKQCDLPCWIDITPGSSHRAEAKGQLVDFFGNSNIYTDTPLFIEWRSDSANNALHGAITFNNDVVDSIELDFDSEALSVQQLIGAIGEPNYVRISYNPQYDYSCGHTALLYPDMMTMAELSPGQVKGVEESQLVSSLFFSSRELDTGPRYFGSDTWVVEWDGYRDYCALRP